MNLQTYLSDQKDILITQTMTLNTPKHTIRT